MRRRHGKRRQRLPANASLAALVIVLCLGTIIVAGTVYFFDESDTHQFSRDSGFPIPPRFVNVKRLSDFETRRNAWIQEHGILYLELNFLIGAALVGGIIWGACATFKAMGDELDELGVWNRLASRRTRDYSFPSVSRLSRRVPGSGSQGKRLNP